eukprot:TRINITY_DN90864_c0_g1_i1.p1 TRINITY_DN90864_c0_g1~~TRINITY_DN90864_c0_g1_i1.p1  ORF type:complete len:494 (+),score=81.13 TRINITY_DN90864_c0_g1_i1:76-1557(+)
MMGLVHLIVICGIPVFVIASIAMPAGVGGGMLYVPLMILTGVADARLAAVLASPIIVGAALAGNLFNIAWQRRHSDKLLLDGGLAVAMVSPALAGNLIGTILNQALPKLVILILLLLIILWSLVGSFTRARRMWKDENNARSETTQFAAAVDSVSTGSTTTGSNQLSSLASASTTTVVGRTTGSLQSGSPRADIEMASRHQHETGQRQEDASGADVQSVPEDEQDTPYHRLSFFSTDTSPALRRRTIHTLPSPQNSVRSSAPGASQEEQVPNAGEAEASSASEGNPPRQSYCDWGKFIFVWVCMIVVVALRGGGGDSVVHIKSCSWQYWTLTAVGFCLLVAGGIVSRRPEVNSILCIAVGAVSAMVGIGGAVILNPMLVKRGVEVQRATATASLLVLSMSTSTSALFILGGSVPLMPALVLGVAAFLGSLSGKTLVGWLVQRTGRVSLIVILLACFILISGIAVFIQGALETVTQIRAGENPLADLREPCVGR